MTRGLRNQVASLSACSDLGSIYWERRAQALWLFGKVSYVRGREATEKLGLMQGWVS